MVRLTPFICFILAASRVLSAPTPADPSEEATEDVSDFASEDALDSMPEGISEPAAAPKTDSELGKMSRSKLCPTGLTPACCTNYWGQIPNTQNILSNGRHYSKLALGRQCYAPKTMIKPGLLDCTSGLARDTKGWAFCCEPETIKKEYWEPRYQNLRDNYYSSCSEPVGEPSDPPPR